MSAHNGGIVGIALFNLLTVALVGGTERKTLKELALPDIDPSSDIGSRLAWGYWVAIGSLVLFVLLAISCAFLSCARNSSKDNHSGSDSPLTKRKRSESKKMQADRLTRIQVDGTHPYQHSGIYPDINTYTSRSLNAESAVTTKTAEVFPPASYNSNQPSMYKVNKTSSGYSIQPTSAAVNIDNRNPQMSALSSLHYNREPFQQGSQMGTYYIPGSIMPDPTASERVILNRPDLTSNVSTVTGPVALSLPRQGPVATYQDGTYSINVNPNHGRTSPAPFVHSMGTGHAQSYPTQSYPTQSYVIPAEQGPPGYSSLHRPVNQPGIITTFGSSGSTNVPFY